MDTATTGIYTLSLHDALPISRFAMRREKPTPMLPNEWPDLFDISGRHLQGNQLVAGEEREPSFRVRSRQFTRSEEHTSELQSRLHLVCRLLLEKKNMYLRNGI